MQLFMNEDVAGNAVGLETFRALEGDVCLLDFLATSVARVLPVTATFICCLFLLVCCGNLREQGHRKEVVVRSCEVDGRDQRKANTRN